MVHADPGPTIPQPIPTRSARPAQSGRDDRCLAATSPREPSRAAGRPIACVLVIKTPNPDWVEVIAEGIPKYAKKAVIKTTTEPFRTSKTETRAGADALGHLQRGRSIVFVSPDPEATLDEIVLAAADATVVIPPLTPALLRKVIRGVSKQSARGVTAEMAGLPVTAILSAIRPGLSGRECLENMRRALSKRVVPKGLSVLNWRRLMPARYHPTGWFSAFSKGCRGQAKR